MNWQNASEIVCGLVLTHKIAPSAVRADGLFPPYNDVVKLYKAGITEPEQLIEKVDIGPINASLDAVKNLNGLSGADWLSILNTTATSYDTGNRMIKLGNRMMRGENVDISEVRHLANIFGKEKTGRVSLQEAINMKLEIPRVATGMRSVDRHLNGFPGTGLIVVGGDSSVGKSTFMVDISKSFAVAHPGKIVADYSIEMTLPEVVNRFAEINGELQSDITSRIAINTDALTADEIVADASRIDDLGIVFVDFADMLIRGEQTESKTSEIYLTFALAAKQLGIPIVLFCQFNKTYQGGLPRPGHIRWTSMAEKLAWMILMLYRPAEDYHAEKDEDKLPVIADVGYILAWKVRGGVKAHKQEFPGAIQLPFDGERGWSKGEGKWFSLKNA